MNNSKNKNHRNNVDDSGHQHPTSNDVTISKTNSEESYLGKFSDYLSDSYVYAKDSIVNISDEATIRFQNLTNGVKTTLIGKADGAVDASNGTSVCVGAVEANDTNDVASVKSNHNRYSYNNILDAIFSKNGNNDNESTYLNKNQSNVIVTDSGGITTTKNNNDDHNNYNGKRSWIMGRNSVYDSVTGRSGHHLHRPLPNNSVAAVRNLVHLVKVEPSATPLKSSPNAVHNHSSNDNINNDETSSSYEYNDIDRVLRSRDELHTQQTSDNNDNSPLMQTLSSVTEEGSSSSFDHQQKQISQRLNNSKPIPSSLHKMKEIPIDTTSSSDYDPLLPKSSFDHNKNLQPHLKEEQDQDQDQEKQQNQADPIKHSLLNDDHSHIRRHHKQHHKQHQQEQQQQQQQQQQQHVNNHLKKKISNEEKASRLGEGTIRALRDIALDEALELHYCLRFWTERLERPLLFYLEFAPKLLATKDEGHVIAGEKVSQLQAILARRCSNIGELQQHLWRAGWQSGVAQWGILGGGSEFAAVIGGLGDTEEQQSTFNSHRPKSAFFRSLQRDQKKNKDNRKKRGGSSDYYVDSLLYVRNQKGGAIMKNDSALAAWSIDAIRIVRYQLYNAGSGVAPLPNYQNWPKEKEHFYSYDLYPSNHRKRPSLGDSMMSMEDVNIFDDNHYQDNDLPLWATMDLNQDANAHSPQPSLIEIGEGELISAPQVDAKFNHNNVEVKQFKIHDIKSMADEVGQILNSMETYMNKQRRRRLEKLRPPSRISRNWYFAAIAIPFAGYVTYKLTQRDLGSRIAAEAYDKISKFFAEHVSEPLVSICRELFTRRGREEITDRKARQEVISSLKKMIKNWLDDVHPNIPEDERMSRAEAMDMSLLEATKENSIQNILEINNIYRLSLIEMQFIKKEMMNALYAMDELMGSNEINMRLTSMTPAFLLVSSCRYLIKKVYYALFKLGRSKEAVYASFRHIILDIERLLVMRDNPPISPPPLPTGVNYQQKVDPEDRPAITNSTFSQDVPISGNVSIHHQRQHNNITSPPQQTILSADDLGMLMLLVHECRIILYEDRRRFTRQELRNVSEDLAELAGERGAVSVQQQLRIIARMSRTYSFLKVISSGIPFSVDDSLVSI